MRVVKIPSGISKTAAVLEKLSTSRRNEPPKAMATGVVTRLSGPTIMRTMWGKASPTKTDHPRNGHRRRGNQGGRQQDQQLLPFRIKAYGSGLLIPQGQDIHPPAQDEEPEASGQDGSQRRSDLGPVGVVQVAHGQ